MAAQVLRDHAVDVVFVASGTGGTQGGIVAAAAHAGRPVEVVGVSVARTAPRGTAPVSEAAAWAGRVDGDVTFVDSYIGEGYGSVYPNLANAVAFAWRFGLPVDTTYTGKAFLAMVESARRGDLEGRRVLFWHTGGLWNHLAGAQ